MMPSELIEFLDPKVLARVDSLELVAKFIVEGFMLGLHRSPYHGFSSEFSAYRQYAPGDELRFIDWRVFGRTDKHYVKQFEETTNLNCILALDMSASMRYPEPRGGTRDTGAAGSESGPVTKQRYASYIAAALAYLMHKQGDAVGMALMDSERFEFVPASSKSIQLNQLLSRLANAHPANTTDLRRGLTRLAERIRRRGLIVLVSDLMVDREELFEGLRYARYRNHEIIMFQVLSEEERRFPFDVHTNFVDSETGRTIVTEPGYIRREYVRLLEEHIAAIKDQCEEMNIDFLSLTTDQRLGDVLMTYLSRRMARM